MKIIAYGSLMNQGSLEKTLGRPAPLTKFLLPNWKRVFNAPFDGYAFLNLERNADTGIEAAYFEMSDAELGLFAEREAGSVLVEVAPDFYAFIWPEDDCLELPVLQSYLVVCNEGAVNLEVNFLKGMQLPSTVLDDLGKPLYV